MAIVIVDDSPTMLVCMKHFIKKCNLPVVTFSSPSAAQAYLRSNPAHVVIVDCNMPEMDGLEFITRLREDTARDMLPIIMVTQRDDKETRAQAIQCGATDFLTKPVNAKELEFRIRNLLRLNGRLRDGEWRGSGSDVPQQFALHA